MGEEAVKMPVPTSPDITPTYIYNPLKEDFKDYFAEDKTPQEYIIHSKELVLFPKYLADHFGNKLVRKIALEASASIAWDIREKEAREKVFVTV